MGELAILGLVFVLVLVLVLVLFAALLVSLYLKKWRRRRSGYVAADAADLSVSDNGLLHDVQDHPHHTPFPPPPLTPLLEGEDERRGGEEKRRRKRGRKKRQETDGGGDRGGSDGGLEREGFLRIHTAEVKGEKGVAVGGGRRERVLECSFPFSSFASATQRKIKVHYDQLVKSNQSKALTVAQVGDFVNCLAEARNELQHKSDSIQRSFKIKRALLFKADRSSFDRLCQQVHKLEAEHKRLEEDAAVYNLLQEQLKLSPAYKTMLEIGESMENKDNSEQPPEFADISFEDLLAQEKKDSFWIRNGKLRSCTS